MRAVTKDKTGVEVDRHSHSHARRQRARNGQRHLGCDEFVSTWAARWVRLGKHDLHATPYRICDDAIGAWVHRGVEILSVIDNVL